MVKIFYKQAAQKSLKNYTYSVKNPGSDFFGKILKLEDGKSFFEIFNKEKYLGLVRFKIPGIFNVYNIKFNRCCSFVMVAMTCYFHYQVICIAFFFRS